MSNTNREPTLSFKYPGGDVASVTGIWIILAIVGIIFGITSGMFPWYFAACVVTGLAGLGMWFQLKLAGYLFAIINSFLTVIGIWGSFRLGFSLELSVKTMAFAYAAWIAIDWCRQSQTQHNY